MGRTWGRCFWACVRTPRRLSDWSRGRERLVIEDRAERSQQVHLVGLPGPGEEWDLICALTLMCCGAKFFHLTLDVGDLSLSVRICAPCFLKIAEMPIM